MIATSLQQSSGSVHFSSPLTVQCCLSWLAAISAAKVSKVLSSTCLRASPLDVLPTALSLSVAHIANLPFIEGLQDCTDVASAEELWFGR